jgi:hypothetical protein
MKRAETTATVFLSSEERDDVVEASYTWRRFHRGDVTTLAIVAAEKDAFAREFIDWTADRDNFRPDEPVRAGLVRWQICKFGAALETAAHGILWAVVRRATRGDVPPLRVAKLPRRKTGEGSLDYVRRIAIANGWIRSDAPAARNA